MTKINPVVVHDVSETFTVLFDEGTRLFWIGLLYGICVGMLIVMTFCNIL